MSASTGEIDGVRIISIISKNDLHDTSEIKSGKVKIITDYPTYKGGLVDIFLSLWCRRCSSFFFFFFFFWYRYTGMVMEQN